jgi:hypothetical protein
MEERDERRMDEKHRTTAAPVAQETCFVIVLRSEAGEGLARTVIESLRAFGGPLRNSPVWAFLLDLDRVSNALPAIVGLRCFPLAVEETYQSYPFAEKVYACARAEAMAGPEIRSLVWLSLDSLIIKPPLLFDLGPVSGIAEADAAFRPVHHQNVGSLAGERPDDFWRAVYRTLEVDDMPHTVTSFVDGRTLRPYFNTHCFAFSPAMGLARAWWAYFVAMVTDEAFQAGPCRDQLHRVFLHQAILSTLVPKLLAWERVRLLPPEYNYPLNLLNEMPADRRAPTLNSLVNAVYEDALPWTQITIQEPLRSWLKARMSGGIEGAG